MGDFSSRTKYLVGFFVFFLYRAFMHVIQQPIGTEIILEEEFLSIKDFSGKITVFSHHRFFIQGLESFSVFRFELWSSGYFE